MMTTLAEATWRVEQTAEAMAALARKAGYPLRAADPPAPPTARVLEDQATYRDWVERVADWFGLEAQHTTCKYAYVDSLIGNVGPALFPVGAGAGARVLAILDARRGGVRVLLPDHSVRVLPIADVRGWIDTLADARAALDVDRILAATRVSGRRLARAREAIVREALGGRGLAATGFMIRIASGASFVAQARAERLGRPLALLVFAHAGQLALGLLSWWMLGRGALEGRLDRGWLYAWALLVLSQVPLRMLENWQQARFAIEGGALLKRRLLAGAVALPTDEIRREGAGQLLGRVLESQAVEALAVGAGLTAFVAGLELVAAAGVLASGASGGVLLALLVVSLVLAFAACWRYTNLRDAWTAVRLAMTHDLVERIVGHRTRLAQQVPEKWHEGEDETLESYLDASARMDRMGVRLQALLSRGWLLVALAGLLPTLIVASAPPSAIAVAVGGMLLAQRALQRLVQGLAALGAAAIAWRVVAPLFHAAARAEPPSPPDVLSLAAASPDRERTVLDVRDVVFRYRDKGEPVLRGCTLRIGARDRLLLEGGSGGGKSTLGAVLAGLRVPESGLLLLGGLDRKTLGALAWRRRVVAVPQFHENHVLSATLDFNLLMGRGWPAKPQDEVEADEICRELGLGPLIDRMPAGIAQRVGEIGWQLSHGERSRVYIARALLQRSEIVVLDESFAALDPETMTHAMECVRRRTNALLVIAHP